MNTKIASFRADTIGCDDLIFLNNAGSAMPPKQVTERIVAYLQEEATLGGYAMADKYASEIQTFYAEAAIAIGAKAHQIAWSVSATDAYFKALWSVKFAEGDKIITTEHDYASNQIAFLALAKRFGIEVIIARSAAHSGVDLVDMQQLIESQKPKLVAVTHVPTYSGCVQEIEAIGQLCDQHEVLYIVDACQSFGQMPLDVTKIKCDFLTATGRKFMRGPRGTGLLYLSEKVLQSDLEPFSPDMYGADWTGINSYTVHANARRFEQFEIAYATLLGFKEALVYANQIGYDQIHAMNQTLLTHLRGRLEGIQGVQVLDIGPALCNILTFQKAGRSLDAHKTWLNKHRIMHSISTKTVAQIQYGRNGIDWAIRLSPHYYNTIDELDRAADIIAQL